MARKGKIVRIFYGVILVAISVLVLFGLVMDFKTYADLAYVGAHPATTPTPRIVYRYITKIEYRPAEDVAIIGRLRCGPHGGLLGYYVGLFNDSDYQVACRDRHSIYTAHGGLRLSP